MPATTPRLVLHPLPARLSVRHRLLLIAEILVAYAHLLRALRTNDLQSMVDAARRLGRPHTTVMGTSHSTAVRLGAIVHRVLGVLPTDKRCLIRSLVLVRLLACRAIDARLIIGVQVDGGFAAHAWVEHEGRAVIPAGRFQRLHEL